MSYLPCELHCHSVHSDGSFSVAELLRRAYDDHLALIALTDHNTVSGHGELDDSITPAVPGIEWTTFFGHMLVLGARDFVDWRDAVPANIDDKIDQVHAAGGCAAWPIRFSWARLSVPAGAGPLMCRTGTGWITWRYGTMLLARTTAKTFRQRSCGSPCWTRAIICHHLRSGLAPPVGPALWGHLFEYGRTHGSLCVGGHPRRAHGG